MNVRYRVELSQAERAPLTTLLSSDKHAARKLKRACRRPEFTALWRDMSDIAALAPDAKPSIELKVESGATAAVGAERN